MVKTNRLIVPILLVVAGTFGARAQGIGDLPLSVIPRLVAPLLDEDSSGRTHVRSAERRRPGSVGKPRSPGPDLGREDRILTAPRGAVVRDGTGRQTGSRDPVDSSGRTVVRDRFGTQVGREDRDSSGRVIVRDRFGTQTGSRDPVDSSGRTVIRDRFGNQIGREDRDSSGRVVVRDRFGTQIGSRDPPDSSGRVVVRDRFGRQIGVEERRR